MITRPLSARQIKAARALLDWSQEDLAAAAQLSVATIRKLELGYISPRDSTARLIRQAIECAGIELMDVEGVRRSFENVSVFAVPDGAEKLFEDMTRTIFEQGGSIVIVTQSLGELKNVFGDKYQKADGSFAVRCLIADAKNAGTSFGRLEIRSFSRKANDTISFCVYGNKCALLTANTGMRSQIVSIKSETLADDFRRQFLSLWERGVPILTQGQKKDGSKREK